MYECVCVRMLYLLDSFFCFVPARFAAYSLQITLQIQYTSCVFWVWFLVLF